MDSYTFGSDEFMEAILDRANVDAPYPITLNRTDFKVFVTILQKLALHDEVKWKDIPTIPGYGTDETDPLGDWAQSWLSGIAETLGVEGI